jgi:hypothetical protein
LIVKYEGAYDENGEKLLRNKGPNAWDPWDLLRTDLKNERIIGVKTVRKQCTLADGPYDVAITGVYENPIPSQRCGSHVTVEVIIQKGERKIYAGTFEDGCAYTFKSDVVTEVLVTPKSLNPQVKKVHGNEFYK